MSSKVVLLDNRSAEDKQATEDIFSTKLELLMFTKVVLLLKTVSEDDEHAAEGITFGFAYENGLSSCITEPKYEGNIYAGSVFIPGIISKHALIWYNADIACVVVKDS